jgi:hypothetical protein
VVQAKKKKRNNKKQTDTVHSAVGLEEKQKTKQKTPRKPDRPQTD